MLRYFYIIVCIQACFCSVYVDNNDYEIFDRRVRRTTSSQKKETRSQKKSKVVRFDVQNFMQASDSQAGEDHTVYRIRSKKKLHRPANDAYIVEPHDNAKRRMVNTRSNPEKYPNPRHFDFHSPAFEDKSVVKLSHGHKKATSNLNSKVDEKIDNDHDKKCSFRNMKIPFFSHSKATVKSKRHKKRRMFCFNCADKTTATPLLGQTTDIIDIKTPDYNKDNSDEKTSTGFKLSKLHKRACDKLCPKCVRALFTNFKKKTTKKVVHNSSKLKHDSNTSPKKRTMKQKADLLDSFKEEYDNEGEGSERLKRNENDEAERERRLKELEEVERKIENVQIQITTPASLIKI